MNWKLVLIGSALVASGIIACKEPEFKAAPARPGIPQCQEGQNLVGGDVVFLVDNSRSNQITDCNLGPIVGQISGISVYECRTQTNREKAILETFTTLKGIYNKPEDTSSFSVVSFPDKDGDWRESSKLQRDWTPIEMTSEQNFGASLSFTRQPFGLTPYQAAFTAAKTQFLALGQSNKNKVAVFITDGEPTDKRPITALNTANELKDMGIKILTVFVNNGKTRTDRVADHYGDLLAKQRSSPNWWEEGRFVNFDDYFSFLVGDASTPSLVERVTSKIDPSCEDQPGKTCARFLQEATAEELGDTVRDLVIEQALSCQ